MCIPPSEPLAHPIIVKCESLSASELWYHSLMPPIGRDCSLCSLLSTAALHPSLPPSLLSPSLPAYLAPSSPSSSAPPALPVASPPSPPLHTPAHSYIPHPTPPSPRSRSPPLPLAPAQYLIRDAAHTADCYVPLFLVSRRRPVLVCGINMHRLLVVAGSGGGGGGRAEAQSLQPEMSGEEAATGKEGRRSHACFPVEYLPPAPDREQPVSARVHTNTQTHARSQVDGCD